MIDPAQAFAGLRQAAERECLPLGELTHTYNSRPAQELFKWAEAKGRGEAFLSAAFGFFFVQGRNIGTGEVLGELAESSGLCAGEARSVLAEGSFREAVDADWARAREMEIQVIPTFFMGENRLVGAQPYEAMERFVMNSLSL